MPKKRGGGRPPAGRDEAGKPVAVTAAYAQMTIRVPRPTKTLLTLVSAIEGRSAGHVVEAALERYVAALPADTRRGLEGLSAASVATSKKRGS